MELASCACSVLFRYGQCERVFRGIYRLHEAVLLLPEAQDVYDAAINQERRHDSERSEARSSDDATRQG